MDDAIIDECRWENMTPSITLSMPTTLEERHLAFKRHLIFVFSCAVKRGIPQQRNVSLLRVPQAVLA